MTLPELYERVGGDYQDVLERLDDDQTILTFVLRFPSDTSYDQLMQYLSEKDIKHAFYAAHTLKGTTQSLGFDRLGNCAVTVCEMLREGSAPSEHLLEQLQTEYQCVITTIQAFKNGI